MRLLRRLSPAKVAVVPSLETNLSDSSRSSCSMTMRCRFCTQTANFSWPCCCLSATAASGATTALVVIRAFVRISGLHRFNQNNDMQSLCAIHFGSLRPTATYWWDPWSQTSAWAWSSLSSWLQLWLAKWPPRHLHLRYSTATKIEN